MEQTNANMKPVNVGRKEELEKKFGPICSLTIECIVDGKLGIFSDQTQITVYRCAKDNDKARGGPQSELVPSASRMPCSQEYAANCPSFKTHGHLLTVVYKDLGYESNGQIHVNLEH